jgi:monoamine oxidase
MKILIIGGGLSGLAFAEMLEPRGHDYMLVEARARFGGRIKTEYHGAGYFDMGPAWFWPDQPRIAALIDRLGLEKFDQFTDGIFAFEDEHGEVERGHGFASMQASWRLKGGFFALTQALANRLPDTRKILNAPVIALSKVDACITATLGNGELLKANRVVLALPPRLAAKITYTPSLPETATQSMQAIATWMAGQAKAVAIYDKPFWREAGMSGNAMSRHGPMVEIHDASPFEGGSYALFGFIGTPPPDRQDEKALHRNCRAQLGRLFGVEAANPLELYIKDWAFDPYTSTQADKSPLYDHPAYGMPGAFNGLWNNSLHFGGTEVAPQFGGYIEGALESAENLLETFEV